MPLSLPLPLASGPRADLSLLGGAFVAVALAMAVITALVLVSRSQFRRRAVRTTGTIVAHEPVYSRSRNPSSSVSSGPTYYCVVEFTLPGGEAARGRTRTASSPPAGRVGGTATVFYDPGDPSRVSLDTGRTAVMTGCVLALVAVLALAFLLFGVFILEIGSSAGG